MGRPRRVLDLFCGAGGAGYGYYLGGCEVTGVDIEDQPGYPFDFVQADALTFPLEGFDLIHASPPCQQYSSASAPYRKQGREYPDLIAPVRERLISSGIPWVIENVEGAPLERPVMLCGTMLGLQVYRHRLFECSFPVEQPAHPDHLWYADKQQWDANGGHIRPSMRLGGNEDSRAAMGISWMTGAELQQAVPPAFTRYIAESGGSRPCVICGKWWSPKRVHAKTCSARCRKALSRIGGESVTSEQAA
jgi:DNA (cytosine-5)-methyltransferase 1